MITTALFVALAVVPAEPLRSPAGPSSESVADSVWTHQGVVVRRFDGPDRRLEWIFVVAAPRSDVWDAWVDPEQMITWAAPGAYVDLRVGGSWEVHFQPDRPPGQRGSDANEISAIISGSELHIRAGAPSEFPTIRAEKTDFIVRLDEVSPNLTRVHVTQSGWGTGVEWDRGFAYLADANAEWLSWMVRRFVSGPLEWGG